MISQYLIFIGLFITAMGVAFYKPPAPPLPEIRDNVSLLGLPYGPFLDAKGNRWVKSFEARGEYPVIIFRGEIKQ